MVGAEARRRTLDRLNDTQDGGESLDMDFPVPAGHCKGEKRVEPTQLIDFIGYLLDLHRKTIMLPA